MAGVQIISPTATSAPVYGNFYDVTQQSINTPFSAVYVALGNTVFAHGVSINNGEDVVFSEPGIYDVQFSLQITNNSVQAHDFYLYLEQNSTQVPNSLSVVTVPSTHGGMNGHAIAAWNFFVETTTPNEHINLAWSASDTAVKIEFVTVNPIYGFPVAPSVILTVQKIK